MKYKLLINGKKTALITDFMRHTANAFTSLTTSEIWEDMDNHFEVFSPDAFLCFYESANAKMAQLLEAAAGDYRVPLIIISDEDGIRDFEKRAPAVPALKITGVDDMKELQKKISEFIERKKLPSASPAESPAAASAASAAGSVVGDLLKSFEKLQSKKQILVVDDDRTVLKMLKEALSAEYEVTTIAGGKTAEKFLETRMTDLILLDYEMPDESGSDVFAHIRSNERTRDIPVVFLTGVSDSVKIREVLSLGPRGYLLKPINMERLTATIKDILN